MNRNPIEATPNCFLQGHRVISQFGSVARPHERYPTYMSATLSTGSFIPNSDLRCHHVDRPAGIGTHFPLYSFGDTTSQVRRYDAGRLDISGQTCFTGSKGYSRHEIVRNGRPCVYGELLPFLPACGDQSNRPSSLYDANSAKPPSLLTTHYRDDSRNVRVIEPISIAD